MTLTFTVVRRSRPVVWHVFLNESAIRGFRLEMGWFAVAIIISYML